MLQTKTFHRPLFKPAQLRVMLLFVIAAIFCCGTLSAQASDIAQHDDLRMDALIQEIERNEAKYGNLDVTLQRTHEFVDQKWTVLKSVETIRTVYRDDFFFAEREQVDQMFDGRQRTYRSSAFFDGEKTTAIEYGNSVNILHRHYEPAYVFPPHCWTLMHLEINFPLSVYLRGTAAMDQCKKVRRLVIGTGSIFEVNFAKSEYLGEADFNGLSCVKVKVLKRSREKDAPTIHILWLAKDRNFLCVKSEALATIQGNDYVWAESHIDALREVTDGGFVPQKITTRRYDYASLPKGEEKIHSKESLMVKSLAYGPEIESDELKPTIPDGLPVYEISDDQKLVGSPSHPVPTGKPATTTLEEIVENVREAEKLYETIDLTVSNRYRVLGREVSSFADGFIRTEESNETVQYIQRGKNCSYAEVQESRGEDGQEHLSRRMELFDGIATRSTFPKFSDEGEKWLLESASIAFTDKRPVATLRPHSLLFSDLREYRTLSDVLDSEWYNTRKSTPVNITYVGDAMIDGQLCHQLRRDLLNSEGKATSQHILWICPGKNYLVVRTEWMQFRKSLTLPTSIHVVTDWQEISPGVWMWKTFRSSPFQWISPSGISEGRLIHQWQRDFTVEDVKLDVDVEDAHFSEMEIPAGTQVTVYTDKDRFRYTQAETGQLELTEEQMEEFGIELENPN